MARFYAWTRFTWLAGGQLITASLGLEKVAPRNATLVKPKSNPARRIATRCYPWPGGRQRLCRVEPLEGRALLTGGLSLGDYVLEPTANSSEPPAAEVWISRPASAGNAEKPLPQRSESCERANTSAAVELSEHTFRHAQVGSFPSSLERQTRPCSDDGRERDNQRGHETADGGAADEEQGAKEEFEGSTPASGATDAAPSDGDGTIVVTEGDDGDSPANFTPRGDWSDGSAVPEPSGTSPPPTDPVESSRVPWQSPQSAAAERIVSSAATNAVERASLTDQAFHYFLPTQTAAGALSPSLAEEPLGRQAVRDTFIDLALLPPTSRPAMADISAELPDPTPRAVIPVSSVVDAATPPVLVNQATLARAQHVMRSIDAALAELSTEGPAPAHAPEPVRGTRSSGTARTAPHDSCEEQGVADSSTMRLGFFALGSLVLGSRWTPRARRHLASSLLKKRDVWFALVTRRRIGRSG